MTEKTFAQLRKEAQESGIRGATKLRKTDLQQRLNVEDTDLALKVGKQREKVGSGWVEGGYQIAPQIFPHVPTAH